MIRTIALLCFIAAPALAGTWSPGLRVRFDVSGFGTTSFMNLPQSGSAAILRQWVTVPRPPSPAGLESLVLWCSPSDYTVCVLVDDTDYIAGVQIALDIDNYSGAVFDWDVQGFTQWTATVDGETKNYWTAQQYYISASTLATDAQTRIANRDQGTILQDGGVWVTGFNGILYRISTTVSDITNATISDFTKQACIPLMGNHYYYKMAASTVCESDTMFPWFPLVQSNQLIGLGFVTFGVNTVPTGKIDWFEKPPRLAVQVIVPRGPECLYDLTDSAGLVTMHTYFIKNPFLVNCLIQ